jgi:choline kinase
MDFQQETTRNKVVAHYNDGRLLKGYTHDFTPARNIFHLTSQEESDFGTIHEIKLSDLKAVFFVKTWRGSLKYKEKKRFEETDTSHLRGMKIKVIFKDGETIRGVSLGYSKMKRGFFVIPLDPLSNNERVYILNAAVREVKIAAAAEI